MTLTDRTKQPSLLTIKKIASTDHIKINGGRGQYLGLWLIFTVHLDLAGRCCKNSESAKGPRQ